jgi:hypothetical protein
MDNGIRLEILHHFVHETAAAQISGVLLKTAAGQLPPSRHQPK